MADEQPKRVISSDTLKPERIPPGQHFTDKWPILHYNGIPSIDIEKWELRIFGLVEEEVRLSWEEFRSLPATEVRADWHCVTTWSKLDMLWTGVSARDVASLVKPLPQAQAVMIHCLDGYSTNLLMEDFLQEDVVFAWSESGKDLEPAKGGPLRLVVPKLYAWKSAKWVSGIEFMAEDRGGYWELRGYHMRGDPWKEERYSERPH